MGLFLKKRVEMPDKIILGNTEFVFDRKLGFHVGEWTVWDRKTKILLEFQSTEGNIGDIVLEKVNWVNDHKDTIIVLLETMKAADKDHRVFKLQFEAGEFDMVIYDQKENSCEIFEIKHSSKQVPFQYRHLVDEDKCQRTERRFGPIQGRYILYRGEDAQMENGVQYWNVENYLKALPTLDIVQVQEIGMQSIEPTL